jgi:integrase
VPPRVEDQEVEPATVEQVAALAGAVPDRYSALVVLLAGSGLRIGEAFGLEVGDVDFLRRTVRVERQRLQSGNTGAREDGQVGADRAAGAGRGRRAGGPRSGAQGRRPSSRRATGSR